MKSMPDQISDLNKQRPKHSRESPQQQRILISISKLILAYSISDSKNFSSHIINNEHFHDITLGA